MPRVINPKHIQKMTKHNFIHTPYPGGSVFHGTYCKKGFSFRLKKVKDGYLIEPPIYKFTGVISHFRFVDEEERQFRNKCVIIKIVRSLKDSNIWSMILNKQFFTLNEFNKHMETAVVKKQFRRILSI